MRIPPLSTDDDIIPINIIYYGVKLQFTFIGDDKKIDDKKFQCLLFEEDLEENNISLDDFFRNDTEKIHGLLDVVMEEARKYDCFVSYGYNNSIKYVNFVCF